jgi:hypothetical protein
MTEKSMAERRFFQRLAHRFGAGRVDEAEDHHLVSQQLQRPMASSTGRVGAGRLNQLLLDVPLDLDLVWACWLRPVINRRLQSFDDESLSEPSDRFQTAAQSCDDFIVGVASPMHPIRQQQNTGMGQLTTGRPPAANQVFQGRAFLRNQRDTILFNHRAPSLDMHPARECPQETGACVTRQSEIDRSSKRTSSDPPRSIFQRDLAKSPVNRRLTDH